MTMSTPQFRRVVLKLRKLEKNDNILDSDMKYVLAARNVASLFFPELICICDYMTDNDNGNDNL